mmetsp:Transcript_76133/g.134713  ORF Transcript_76133/g.134713 Transcript_76133/m.134713 type:complete len:662 (+) Transcript_76133:110-2095(+)
MDAGDVSLSIRRARRSGAKQIDLSHRGLQSWPDLFSLKQLQAIDLSGNELRFVDPAISQLVFLEELNLANNSFEILPELNTDALQHLHSVVLDGNPVASSVGSSTIRQLARPPVTPGQTPAQVIGGLLATTPGREAPPARSASRASSLATPVMPMATEVEEVSDVHGLGPEPLPQAARRARPQEALPNKSEAMMAADVDRILAGETDTAPWRQEQKAMLKEMERLQARVAELEAEQSGSSGRPGDKAEASGVPSWLHEERKNDLNRSLPSRRGGLNDSDEAADLKNQLREEQRKSKRLQTDVQRLTDRLNESGMTRGSLGSAAQFEFAEVELGEIINQGGFSVVHKGVWHSTKVAIKKIFDPKIDQDLLDEFDNEVKKLEQIRHPNILMLLAVHRKPPALSIITELVEGGSYYQLLHAAHQFNSASGSASSLSFSQHAEILESTAVALAFMHARGIVHRDVKSHNVLLSPHLEVKVCDFGLARMRSELMTGAMQFAGTPNYMAPEVFRNQRYTEKVDVFAYGTLLWEAMANDIPFANLDPPEIREKVLMGQMLAIPASTPSTVKTVILASWTLEQERRPLMAEVLRSFREALKEVGSAGSARARRPRTAGSTRTGTREPLSSTGGYSSASFLEESLDSTVSVDMRSRPFPSMGGLATGLGH